MRKLTASDPETHSADIVAENIEHLKALFPFGVQTLGHETNSKLIRRISNGAASPLQEPTDRGGTL